MGTKMQGKKTVVFLNSVDLTSYSNNSQLELSADSHDITVYGQDQHAFEGGLQNGQLTVSGFYDTTASVGPRAVIRSIIGQKVPFIHRPEGTGSGLPQDSGLCVVTKYTQTHPVADMVTWSVDLQLSDFIDPTAQP